MRVHVDTNILIDFVCKREGFFLPAQELFATGYTGRVQLMTSALSVVNTMYVARKHDSEVVKKRLKQISQFVKVADLRADVVIETLGSDWKDYEDATQERSAVVESADCIVTRNKQDFKSSSLPVYTVDELLATL